MKQSVPPGVDGASTKRLNIHDRCDSEVVNLTEYRCTNRGMHTLSLNVHAVLPNESLSALPRDVRDLLREFAAAANEASLALQQANLIELRATAINDGDDYAARATVRQRLVDDLMSSASSYRDQLVVTYARVAADYAVFAGQVASCLIASREPSTPTGEVTRPSRILADLADELPLVQIYSDAVDDTAMADQNVELRRLYTELTSLVERRMTDAKAGEYDDRQAAASRTPTDYDLVAEFPAMLHSIAAATMWAIAAMNGGSSHGT